MAKRTWRKKPKVHDADPLINIEIRGAELVLLGAAKKYLQFTHLEFDWYVHGDEPPHSADRIPDTDEEWAALLAHEIDRD